MDLMLSSVLTTCKCKENQLHDDLITHVCHNIMLLMHSCISGEIQSKTALFLSMDCRGGTSHRKIGDFWGHAPTL